MPTSLSIASTVRNQTAWEDAAKELFDSGAVGIMERHGENFTIYGRVLGYCEDATYGRLIEVQRMDAKGKPVSKPDAPSAEVGGIENRARV